MSAKGPAIAHAKTWKVLENSRNQSATILLSEGLASSVPTIRHRCLAALVTRPDEFGYERILTHWTNYDQSDIGLLRAHAPKFTFAVRRLLQNGSLLEKQQVLRAMSDLELTDAADILLGFVLDEKHALHVLATNCFHSMCRRLGQSCRRTGSLSNPIRQSLLKKLHPAIVCETATPGLMEAWLLLIHWDDAQQRGLIGSPNQSAYLRMVDIFANTNEPGILQLLAGYYWRAATPQGIHDAIVQKQSPQLAVEIARLAPDEILESVLEQLRYSEPLSSMQQVDAFSADIDHDTRGRLLLMMAASRNDIDWTLDASVRLSESGDAADQTLAAAMLLTCQRPSLEQFVRMYQSDGLRPLVEQRMAYSTSRILSWLGGPNAALKQAARFLFYDFTLNQLLHVASHWPADRCRVMANIVMHAEESPVQKLVAKLKDPSHSRTLVALQVVQWFQCAEAIKEQLPALVRDPRPEVRTQAIDILSALEGPNVEDFILQLLQDVNSDIADAAHRAVDRRERHRLLHRSN